MTDLVTRQMVVSAVREFQARQEDLERRFLALEGLVHQVEARVIAIEVQAKNFSGRLNGMEDRLGDKATVRHLEDARQTLNELKIATAGNLALQQLANRALSEWVYNSDFDREFALVNALEATL